MASKPKPPLPAARPPRPPRPGRKPILNEQHTAVLRAILSEQPRCTIGLLTWELAQRTGVEVHPVTVRKALRSAGIERLPPLHRGRTRAAEGAGAQAPEGVTDRLRRDFAAADPDSARSTDLSDAQWALIADLFERGQERRGVPATYPRRAMVNACYHLLRTGCSWRDLPGRYPPWQSVYKAFSRWAAAGLFDAMHERLYQRSGKPAGNKP